MINKRPASENVGSRTRCCVRISLVVLVLKAKGDPGNLKGCGTVRGHWRDTASAAVQTPELKSFGGESEIWHHVAGLASLKGG